MKYTINDVPSDLRSRLSDRIDHMAVRERNSRHQRLGIAASLLIILAAGGTWMATDQPQSQPTELTPKQAARETERALKIFAQAIDRGKEGAREAEKATRQATDKAFNTIKKYSK